MLAQKAEKAWNKKRRQAIQEYDRRFALWSGLLKRHAEKVGWDVKSVDLYGHFDNGDSVSETISIYQRR